MIRRIKYLLVLSVLVVVSLTEAKTQCWLSDAQQHVNALGGETLVIGATGLGISSNGRVCYKWTPDVLILSDLNSPTVTVHMPNESGNYYFHVKRISDDGGVQNCTVTVTVEESFSIVEIIPLYECWTDGDPITVNQFRIVTSPIGMERHVILDAGSRVARCNASTRRTCAQQLYFSAYKNGTLVDEKSCEITVYSNNSSNTTEYSAELTALVRKLKRADAIIEKANYQAKLIEQGFRNVFPSSPLRFSFTPASFDANVTLSHFICCQGIADMEQASITFGGSIGMNASADYPVNRIPWPPLACLPPQLKLSVSIGFSISGSSSYEWNTCKEKGWDVTLAVNLMASGGISWGDEDDWLYGTAQLYVNPALTGELHILPQWGFDLTGSFELGCIIRGHVKAGWFKAGQEFRFVFCHKELSTKNS